MDGLYEVKRKVIDKTTLDVLKWSVIMDRNRMHYDAGVPLSNLRHFGDVSRDAVPGDNFAHYGSSSSEALLVTMLPWMQQQVGKILYPTYSFTRIYWNGSWLHHHRDRLGCEYSVSICIDSDPEPWGIWVEGTEILLNPGDLIIYKGCEAEHWREKYEGIRTIQTFLHYVDAKGPSAKYKFDTRPELGLPTDFKTSNDG
jgi:hypothetical protein